MENFGPCLSLFSSSQRRTVREVGYEVRRGVCPLERWPFQRPRSRSSGDRTEIRGHAPEVRRRKAPTVHDQRRQLPQRRLRHESAALRSPLPATCPQDSTSPCVSVRSPNERRRKPRRQHPQEPVRPPATILRTSPPVSGIDFARIAAVQSNSTSPTSPRTHWHLLWARSARRSFPNAHVAQRTLSTLTYWTQLSGGGPSVPAMIASKIPGLVRATSPGSHLLLDYTCAKSCHTDMPPRSRGGSSSPRLTARSRSERGRKRQAPGTRCRAYEPPLFGWSAHAE